MNLIALLSLFLCRECLSFRLMNGGACSTRSANAMLLKRGEGMRAGSHSRRLKLHSSVDSNPTELSSANLDWENLGFQYRPTKSHIRFVYKDGEWSNGELVNDEYVKVHIGSTALHYGQAAFEGLKAFAWKDGSVRLFRPDENAARMQNSAERTMMAVVPADKFIEGIKTVVRDNIAYVPPYGTGGALYIRPLLFGSGPRIGLSPSDEYTFIIMVLPVGDYYKGGLHPTPAMIVDEYDRAAPSGVGHVKVAGNYAADLLPNIETKKQGYPIGLYLDAAEHKYIEEFSTSNFVGIKTDKATNKVHYVTPKSAAILPSITNKSLMRLAADRFGYTVEARPIPVEELSEFNEVAACGTAVVVTPVSKIAHIRTNAGGEDKIYGFSEDVGVVTQGLYDAVREIQTGDCEDTFKWMVKV